MLRRRKGAVSAAPEVKRCGEINHQIRGVSGVAHKRAKVIGRNEGNALNIVHTRDEGRWKAVFGEIDKGRREARCTGARGPGDGFLQIGKVAIEFGPQNLVPDAFHQTDSTLLERGRVAYQVKDIIN